VKVELVTDRARFETGAYRQVLLADGLPVLVAALLLLGGLLLLLLAVEGVVDQVVLVLALPATSHTPQARG
jgi:hypothetical protein